MAVKKLVAVKEICVHHNISKSFISELQQNELVRLIRIDRTRYVSEEDIKPLEQMIRLHTDLDINIQGIETILYLLEQLNNKEAELQQMKSLLDFYIPQPTQ